MKTSWQNHIIKNFDEASSRYNKEATLQMPFAKLLALECSQRTIPTGLWVDLGSGTGFLANELERLHPNQAVTRVDSSLKMLEQHPSESETLLFDLNSGLPQWIDPPTLIASNFVLHWINKPEEKLKEWFNALAPGGWIALAIPVEGSFPEWQKAAKKAGVACTAMPFPSKDSILKVIKNEQIKSQRLERFTQESPRVTSLLKTFVQIGGQSSPKQSLSITQWRKLENAWEICQKTHVYKLTWFIQVLLAQK